MKDSSKAVLLAPAAITSHSRCTDCGDKEANCREVQPLENGPLSQKDDVWFSHDTSGKKTSLDCPTYALMCQISDEITVLTNCPFHKIGSALMRSLLLKNVCKCVHLFKFKKIYISSSM